MKARRLLFPLLLFASVLAGCAESEETDSASVEASDDTTTTVAVTQPAVVGSTAPAASAGTRCQTVSLGGEEVAREIIAFGVPCADAEDLLRRIAAPLGPEALAQTQSDGFSCVRTSVQIGHSFPVATYECKRGSERITFSRTTAG